MTHDQEEALELADRVVVMNEGRIEQDDTPEAVMRTSGHARSCMTFIGEVNIFHGRVQGGKPVLGYAWPHEFEISRHGGEDGLPARVRDVRVSGAIARIELEGSAGDVIQVALGREEFDRLSLATGEYVSVRPKRLRVFAAG